MRAVAIEAYGGVSKLGIHEMPVTPPGPHEVLIRLDTAGVGSWDVSARKGDIETEHDFPRILGTDGSGVVVAVGKRVTRFAPGDAVYAYDFDNAHGGFYAEYVTIAANDVGHVPKTLGLRKTGALSVIGLTALQGVDDALRVRRGESVIVHGASGNVGMIAVQLVRWRGARVLATASGSDGVAFVRALGIEKVIDGKRDDIGRAARELVPEGVDALLAFAGGDALMACMDSLRKGGRIAHPNGIEPAPRKRKQITIRSYDAEASPEQFAALNRAVIASGLQVPIAESYPLDRAADAHRRMERGHLLGKIILCGSP
jgi:NADPH:quinone reductase-like Zn-dependent oxidoreductase